MPKPIRRVVTGHRDGKAVVISDTLGRSVKLRVSANALKTVDHRGGLDAYLLNAKNDLLAPKVRDLKKAIQKKQAAAG